MWKIDIVTIRGFWGWIAGKETYCTTVRTFGNKSWNMELELHAPQLAMRSKTRDHECHARSTCVFEDSIKSHPRARLWVRRSHFGVTKVLRLHGRETEIEPDPHDSI